MFSVVIFGQFISKGSHKVEIGSPPGCGTPCRTEAGTRRPCFVLCCQRTGYLHCCSTGSWFVPNQWVERRKKEKSCVLLKAWGDIVYQKCFCASGLSQVNQNTWLQSRWKPCLIVYISDNFTTLLHILSFIFIKRFKYFDCFPCWQIVGRWGIQGQEGERKVKGR